ncbi:PREDICTED: tricin synthase 1-like isoform X3 [Nelumbo nucifera]|uniref:Tricin synthase 1-like isoform X3 n=1 Tax=Nelumbo nucifera TaxID=4432 RepID=A0A1U7Z1Q0_NELNU|nr:PREDICTED: tricin synthase 1-like isoform X3 [Nelumbo nucifera]
MMFPLFYRSIHPMLTLHSRVSRKFSLQAAVSSGPQEFRCSSITSTRIRNLNGAVRALKLEKPRSFYGDSVIVADDDKYGNKQVISVTPQLYKYILANVREPEILRDLREETTTMRGSQMQVSPDQAQLLAMLVQLIGAKRCIEVGVYTGYSSLAIALVLPESGYLVACERDEKSLEVAKRYYKRAGVSHKVDVKHALAADSLKSMILNGEACSYDFAFLDAEKRKYHEYFELLLQLVRVGGMIVVDNVLWHGKVADPLVSNVYHLGGLLLEKGLVHNCFILTRCLLEMVSQYAANCNKLKGSEGLE